MYNVIYIDDYNRKHMCIAQDNAELRFLLDRFTKVQYQLTTA